MSSTGQRFFSVAALAGGAGASRLWPSFVQIGNCSRPFRLGHWLQKCGNLGGKMGLLQKDFFFVNEIMCVTFVSKASFHTLDISNVVVVVVG